ncbi:fumarylacetoacetase [Novosphingobium sp. BL-52-GroH]|uniref:fumarylacetoacetase n=1 Tax=Novosphingobium sp. BL-52-GroH TaxID=3349877 RepID=UPI00384A8935
MSRLNATHDSARTSWVASAKTPGTDFPVQNLPHGVFSTAGLRPRGGVAIGDMILDVAAALDTGLFPAAVADIARAAAEPTLNRLADMGRDAATRLRLALFEILAEDGAHAAAAKAQAGAILVPMAGATLHLPVAIGSFTDFMTSVHHVTAARRSRPARPLNDNFLHLPVAYNSRATSITIDGIPFERPYGQRREADGTVVYAPTAQLDFEVEFGAIVGRGNSLGSRVALDEADDHIFGYVLVNDWSARDTQIWEQRLGPFLGKAFRTTISPWIVTADALEPFRCPAPPREADQPQPLPYLDSDTHQKSGGLDISLDAFLTTSAMRAAGAQPAQIVASRLLDCAWTIPQMLTHHTSGGCNLQPGDLLSSGTVSGPSDESAACMFEITAGTLPIDLPNGEQRNWLEDGDEFVITGRAEHDGYVSIGFGRCGAEILPAA